MKCAKPTLRGLILLACGSGHEGDAASSEEARPRCQRVVEAAYHRSTSQHSGGPVSTEQCAYGSRITLDGNFVVRASTSESVWSAPSSFRFSSVLERVQPCLCSCGILQFCLSFDSSVV